MTETECCFTEGRRQGYNCLSKRCKLCPNPLTKTKAHFAMLPARPHPNVVAIVDMDDGAMSITNDAENVVKHLIERSQLKIGEHLIYCDTNGRWDELLINEHGEFKGFGPLGGASVVTAALKAVETRG